MIYKCSLDFDISKRSILVEILVDGHQSYARYDGVFWEFLLS